MTDSPEQRLARLAGQATPPRDPVRWAQVQALARRAAGAQGALQQRLNLRLQELLDHYEALPAAMTQAGPAPQVTPGPLGRLLQEHLPARDMTGSTAAAPPELKAVRAHRRTWAGLQLQLRLQQLQATVPPQAGPLNTQRLLNQAFGVMQQASPDYLNRLLLQVETLLWLERARLPSTQATATRERRPAR